MNFKNLSSICLLKNQTMNHNYTDKPYFHNSILKTSTLKNPKIMFKVEEMLAQYDCKIFAQKLVVKIDSISKTHYLYANVNGSPTSILLDTGSRRTVISRSLTQPQNVFKIKKILFNGFEEAFKIDEMVKILLIHEKSSPIEISAYVVDNLPAVQILLGQIDIPKIMKFEALDNGNAYLDTIYGRVYYFSWKVTCKTSDDQTTVSNDRKVTKFRVRTKSCNDIDSVRFLVNPSFHYKSTNKLYSTNLRNNTLTNKELRKRIDDKKTMQNSAKNMPENPSHQSAVEVTVKSVSNKCNLNASINGNPISILLDTGSDITLIRRSLVLPENVLKIPHTMEVVCVIGKLKCNEMVKISLTYEHLSSEVFAFVIDFPGYELIIGRNDIPKILKPESLDNGRAYIDTIYGRSYFSDTNPYKFFCHYYFYYFCNRKYFNVPKIN